MVDTKLIDAVNVLVEHVKTDYAAWSNHTPANDPVALKIREEMTERFNESLSFELGSKYIKVIGNSGVLCFVVAKADDKFKIGDILKAASWRAPSRNFARGNVLSGNMSNVNWTGAH